MKKIVNGVLMDMTPEEVAEHLAATPPVFDTDRQPYQVQRAAEYPPMADYIDGIVKGDQAQVQAYINACLAVKVKYPKPS